jgi:hypothetical protein
VARTNVIVDFYMDTVLCATLFMLRREFEQAFG